MISSSTRLLSFMVIPAGRPARALSVSRVIFSTSPLRSVSGATSRRAVVAVLGVAGEVVEQVGDVGGDRRVDGEQPDVLVQPRGLRVVVAGPDVDVAAQAAVRLLPDDQRELAVGLQPDHAVHDMAAGVLERAGPLDVGLLVEAGRDLDDDEDLLAGLGGVDQRVDHAASRRWCGTASA